MLAEQQRHLLRKKHAGQLTPRVTGALVAGNCSQPGWRTCGRAIGSYLLRWDACVHAAESCPRLRGAHARAAGHEAGRAGCAWPFQLTPGCCRSFRRACARATGSSSPRRSTGPVEPETTESEQWVSWRASGLAAERAVDLHTRSWKLSSAADLTWGRSRMRSRKAFLTLSWKLDSAPIGVMPPRLRTRSWKFDSARGELTTRRSRIMSSGCMGSASSVTGSL